jgi:uncharacterized protein DUF5684
LVALPNLPVFGESPLVEPDLAWLLPYLAVWAAVTIPAVVAGWLGVFPKAGQSRWAALVPFYNTYVLVVRVAGLSPLWFVLLLIPPINLIAAILVNIEVARRFGRTEAFGVGMSVFGFILYPLIGFGRAEYDPARPPFGLVPERDPRAL